MTSFENARELEQGEWLAESVTKKSLFGALWLAGLISTVYLVGNASFLAFLSIIFTPSSAKYITDLEVIKIIGMNSTPACCYAVIGLTGLMFCRPSSRFWILGLSAILVETALAIYAFADPGSLPMFTDWLL